MKPQVLILDRDGVLNVSSSDESSPFYYITDVHRLILRPGVREAMAVVRAHGIPTILATKQRCISKGLVTAEMVKLINVRLERLLDHAFDHIFIEPEAEDKHALFKHIKSTYGGAPPAAINLFDDSVKEREIGARLGFTVWDGVDLWTSVCRAFSLNP